MRASSPTGSSCLVSEVRDQTRATTSLPSPYDARCEETRLRPEVSRSLFLVAAVRRLLLVMALLTAACGADRGSHEVDTGAAATITVSSEAFGQGDRIPEQFTCDGDETSPPLTWSGGRGSDWALVVDDPDAPGGTFVHWVVLDIEENARSVATGQVPAGGVQIVNSSGAPSYAGPCPPSGEHRYRFTVYALDTPTGLSARTGLDDALAALSDHATAKGTLTAVYSRQ